MHETYIYIFGEYDEYANARETVLKMRKAQGLRMAIYENTDIPCPIVVDNYIRQSGHDYIVFKLMVIIEKHQEVLLPIIMGNAKLLDKLTLKDELAEELLANSLKRDAELFEMREAHKARLVLDNGHAACEWARDSFMKANSKYVQSVHLVREELVGDLDGAITKAELLLTKVDCKSAEAAYADAAQELRVTHGKFRRVLTKRWKN